MSTLLPNPDSELLSLLKTDNEPAFTELYDRYWERLLVFVMRAVRSQSNAEDIVQELFIFLWKGRNDLQTHGDFPRYIFQSARYLILRYTKRHPTQADTSIHQDKRVLQKYEDGTCTLADRRLVETRLADLQADFPWELPPAGAPMPPAPVCYPPSKPNLATEPKSSAWAAPASGSSAP